MAAVIEIGSSDAPAVLGCSRFKTPWRLWAEQTGLLKRDEIEGEQLTWGTRLERAVWEGFAQDQFGSYGYEAIDYAPYTRRFKGFMRATPDVLVELPTGPAIIEVKCTVNDPPPVPRVEWLVQVIHQRLVFPEVTRAFIVAFGSLRTEWWEVPAHPKAEQTVLAAELLFYQRCLDGDPPPVSAMDASYLHKAWPYTADEPVFLGREFEKVDEMYQESSQIERMHKKFKDDAAARIQAAMGEHTSAMLSNRVTYTWRPYERDGKTYRRFTRRGGDE